MHLKQQINDSLGGGVIQIAGRFITKKNARPVDERARNGDTLTFSTRKFPRPMRQSMR